MAAQNQLNKILLTRVYVHHELWPGGVGGGEEEEEEEEEEKRRRNGVEEQSNKCPCTKYITVNMCLFTFE